jgi:hypothetical protein
MTSLNKWLLRLGSQNNYSVYSSVFRVFVAILLFKELVSLWIYAPIIFQDESFLVPSNSMFFGLIKGASFFRENIYFFMGVYGGTIILYAFGIGKRITAILVFFCFDLLQRLCPVILNGGDNLLKFLLLYLIFIDSYNYLSIRKLTCRTKYSIYYNNFLSNLFGLCICIHLAFVYFISGLNKIHADVWFHGVATYYTLQLERFMGTSWNVRIANNPLFVTISTYFTLFIEAFYPALVWFKQTKKIIIVCAILMHIGIYIFMMIYDFQLIFIMTQGFFFSNAQWRKVGKRITSIQIVRRIRAAYGQGKN